MKGAHGPALNEIAPLQKCCSEALLGSVYY
jgi:hypothetical protein